MGIVEILKEGRERGKAGKEKGSKCGSRIKGKGTGVKRNGEEGK